MIAMTWTTEAAALGWPDERLELVGLKRQQSDTFFIEIKKEEVPETV